MKASEPQGEGVEVDDVIDNAVIGNVDNNNGVDGGESVDFLLFC